MAATTQVRLLVWSVFLTYCDAVIGMVLDGQVQEPPPLPLQDQMPRRRFTARVAGDSHRHMTTKCKSKCGAAPSWCLFAWPGCSRVHWHLSLRPASDVIMHASAGNRTRVTSMATMYSTTRPLMLLSAEFTAT